MAVADEGVFEHKGFLGLRNRVGPTGFELGDLDAATNIDLDDTGGAMLRRGHGAASIAGVSHSLWSNGDFCFVVIGNTLTQVLPGLATRTIRTGMTSGLPVAFEGVGPRVYYSNGVQNGVIQNGVSRTWGLEVPPRLAPTVVPGELRAGRYQCVLTYLRDDGQESGAPLATSVDLTDGQGLAFDLPNPTDPGIAGKSLYVTKPDGSVLYLALDLGLETTATYISPSSKTVALETQHLSPPPLANAIGVHNGHMLLAVGENLCYSEPFAYELYDLRKKFSFGARIVMLAPVDRGVLVGTLNEVAFIPGATPDKFEYKQILSYGVIPGTVSRAEASQVGDGSRKGRCFVWASTRGICAGFDDGSVVNLTEQRFAYPVQPVGAGLTRRWRGMDQYLATLRGAEVPGNIAG